MLGDRKYGSRIPFGQGIALHSLQLQVSHPTRRERMTWTADPPKSWDAILRKLGIRNNISDRIASLDWHINEDGAEPMR